MAIIGVDWEVSCFIRELVCSFGENKYQVMAKHCLSQEFSVVLTLLSNIWCYLNFAQYLWMCSTWVDNKTWKLQAFRVFRRRFHKNRSCSPVRNHAIISLLYFLPLWQPKMFCATLLNHDTVDAVITKKVTKIVTKISLKYNQTWTYKHRPPIWLPNRVPQKSLKMSEKMRMNRSVSIIFIVTVLSKFITAEANSESWRLES